MPSSPIPAARCHYLLDLPPGPGRLVIAIDGKTVRGAKSKEGKAPHLVAALGQD
jgi:ribosomal protein L24E